MALVSPRSCLCVKSELDLFTVPPTQTSVEYGCTMDYHPVLTLTDNGPIDFNIPGSGEDYMDLTNTLLHLGVKITAADGVNIADAAAIEPEICWCTVCFHKLILHLMTNWFHHR